LPQKRLFQREFSPAYASGIVRHPVEKKKIGRLFAWCPGFDPKSGRLGFSVDIVALGCVFSECFSFSYQFSLRQLLHIH
jgi:hypothetical protein